MMYTVDIVDNIHCRYIQYNNIQCR